MTVFDGHSLRVLFHFARDSPPSRPDVLVVIISMLSSAPVPVTGINFQVTAPKVGGHSLRLAIGSLPDAKTAPPPLLWTRHRPWQ